MRKKIVYIGILLFILAVAVFIAYTYIGSSVFSNAVTKVLTTSNLTISAGSFSYAQVSTANSTGDLIVAFSSGKVNMYLFNFSTFSAWSGYIRSNTSASGISYARSIASNGSVVENNVNASEFLLTGNLSLSRPNVSVRNIRYFNGTAYVVMDNTKGSDSYDSTLRAVVSYFGLTQANIGAYASIGTEAAILIAAIIALGIAAIILIVYGLMKSEPGSAFGTGLRGGGREQASKGYIDELYKNVGKKVGRARKRKG